MGSLISKPKAPAILKPPPPPPPAPTETDQNVKDARDQARRRAAATSGYRGTILNGELGQAVTSKTILG